jgi:hypothetical protein
MRELVQRLIACTAGGAVVDADLGPEMALGRLVIGGARRAVEGQVPKRRLGEELARGASFPGQACLHSARRAPAGALCCRRRACALRAKRVGGPIACTLVGCSGGGLHARYIRHQPVRGAFKGGERACITLHSEIRPPLQAASVLRNSPRRRLSDAIFFSTVAKWRSTR